MCQINLALCHFLEIAALAGRKTPYSGSRLGPPCIGIGGSIGWRNRFFLGWI